MVNMMNSKVSIVRFFMTAALCASASLALRCTEAAYDNPLDPGGDNWTPPTVTFDLGGGNVGGAVANVSRHVGEDGRVGNWPIPARGGLSPSGWYTAPSGGAEVTKNTVFYNNQTVYARWDFTETAGGLNFEMIAVEGGTFTMGCTNEQWYSDCLDDEIPTHRVTLSDFYIMKYEVTQRLWRDVMGASIPTSCGSYGIGDNYPAYCVSWNDIVDHFIPELNKKTGKTYRLPTEAEWEYAARGGIQSKGYKYSGNNNIDSVAWYLGNSETLNRSSPVGTKNANELGIYDMSGNVCEWVGDRYGTYTDTDEINPIGSTEGTDHVVRGGSWLSPAEYARVSGIRLSGSPDIRIFDMGFRLVLPSP